MQKLKKCTSGNSVSNSILNYSYKFKQYSPKLRSKNCSVFYFLIYSENSKIN